MKYDFVLLRFAEDRNISDRGYWYLTEFPLAVGEKTLAPVGTHDRLQCAVVEKLLSAEAKDAPYDVKLIKRTAARLGARKLELDGEEALEFGGARYDEKRFTRFSQLLLVRRPPAQMSAFYDYGVTKMLRNPADDPALYREIAHTNGCVLLAGEEGKRAFGYLLAFVRGEGGELASIGADGETLRLLKEKLT